MKILDQLKNAANKLLTPEKESPILKGNQREVNLLNPALDSYRDISKDKKGYYVKTITYPLPPVKWENKQLNNNRLKRNSKNRYFD